MSHPRGALLGMVALLAALTASWATGTSLGGFSDTTRNPGNSFTAAASFCAAAGTQTVNPDADSYVDENAPANNYGTLVSFEVQSRGGSRNRRALVHFALPALQGCAVTSASLRLYATSSDSGRTLQAYQAATPWTETTVNWLIQPLTVGSPVSVPSGSAWVQFDVTSQVQAMYAGLNTGFVVKDSVEGQNPASTNTFSSREGASYQPELVVTLA